MVVATTLDILVVEDNPADAFRVREALEAGSGGRFRPTFAGGLKEAESRLGAADLVLLDLSLPDSSGAETVARVRRKAPGTPVVVLSGERDEEMTFRCLQHGALDVLLKGTMDGDALVRALTCALERRALAEERDEALERAEAESRGTIRRLATGISRGMAEPLAAVLEGAFELSDGHDASAYGPALKIQRGAWQASSLVRLLQASAGEAKAAPESLELGEVVASHWDRVEEHATDAVAFHRELAADLPPVWADRRLLVLALLCLADHARSSVARGGTVTIRTAREGPQRVSLSATDTGPWLGAGACRRIFEPFYSTDVLGIGKGIGLAPVLGIARQCGGTADVRSVPGVGTTVRILLPVLEEEPEGDSAALAAGAGADAAPTRPKAGGSYHPVAADYRGPDVVPGDDTCKAFHCW